YFQLTEFFLPHYRYPLLQWAPLRWLEKQLMQHRRHIATCGNLFQVAAPGLVLHTSDPSLRHAAFELIADTVDAFNPAPNLLLFKDWPDEEPADLLTGRGYRRFGENGTMVLEVRPDWSHFSDYVAAMRHRYAQRVRKARRLRNGLSCHEATLSEIEAHAGRLEQLYRNVAEKQALRLVWANAAYFKELKRSLGQAARMFFYCRDGNIIAFRTEIVHKQELELHLIGIDYRFNTTHWLYFNILYDAIESAISLGMPRLEMGRTAPYAKLIAGAEKKHFVHYYRMHGFVARIMSRFLLAVYKKNIRRKAFASLRIFRGQ
ncbi:MAG: GNAT family N-acetyltransferase, partial [Chitinophagales bacterium]|nr:GNAT family N-acetyltransferase [Chitinophagales bacterium]MDW8428604.1 GNAT family N-acetyltransferase [Chitinophagales bacterium]